MVLWPLAMMHPPQKDERILVAMSGGVDSSVTAALLREQGYEVVGVTLHLWDAQGKHRIGRCCAPEDREDARRTCEALNIPHFVIDEREAFRREVVDPFVEAYRSGITPSPCVACNQSVKLGRLWEIAQQLGCSRIATGHYARLEFGENGEVQLRRGRDPDKDQSYFLFGVDLQLLRRLIFPLGDFTKAQTRKEGERLGVPNFAKKDSQELCFVPDGNVAIFVEERCTEKGEKAPSPGPILSSDGRVLGVHQGIHRFTIGQRRGLGLGGGAPRYVLRIIQEQNAVVVGSEEELYSHVLFVDQAHWLIPPPNAPFEALVQARYRHRASPALVIPNENGFLVEFHEGQRALTPGQAAVIYLGDRVIGGGIVQKVEPRSPLSRSALAMHHDREDGL
ncbi:MAG: tRNA 2-thiouridine(34) synthase MnmA [Sandaracinaceae bacterium]|nr:tRNA 2-thiouridine(34) synthase MnmA [Sandaracinaceae bacterium]